MRFHVVGAGPAGCTLALLLAKRGHEVRLFERRADPRSGAIERGRSINLAMAARGLAALGIAGVAERLRPHMVAMPGRMLHAEDGTLSFAPYGQRPHEVIHSISRTALTRLLVEAAADEPRIHMQFGRRCSGVTVQRDGATLQFDDGLEEPADVVLAADGAGSALRHSLEKAGLAHGREEPLDHDYKELGIPPGSGLEPHALHIWPRGNFMLIALPNADGSFTATLFLPRRAASATPGFDALDTRAAVQGFFARHFADAHALMPDLDSEFAAHPQGELATLHCQPWQAAGRVLLLGDAAHAIVPFHGQGMNCALEDCRLLDALLATAGNTADALREFEHTRRVDTEAIAQMALENYADMRDEVRSAKWVRQRELALELERRFPQRFVPRYSMVMFHAEIPYSVALERGRIQQRLLDALYDEEQSRGTIDWTIVAARVSARLPPLASAS